MDMVTHWEMINEHREDTLRLNQPLVEGRFLYRLNRFAAMVECNGAPTLVHVANSGRMHELLKEGNAVFLARHHQDHRKTEYDLVLVNVGHTLVSADARLPSTLVHEALLAGMLPQFTGYADIRREAVLGDSRLDLVVTRKKGTCWIEVKSVTLVEKGQGLFPDAPTARGKRHVETLAGAVQQGHRGAVVFVVQREDAQDFAPNDAADPAFGEALREAVSLGVEAYAYRCHVSQREVTLDQRLPVCLRP